MKIKVDVMRFSLNSPIRWSLVCLTALTACAQVTAEQEPWQQAQATEVWQPVPAKVTVNEAGVPSDAVVLFDGSDLPGVEIAAVKSHDGIGRKTGLVIRNLCTERIPPNDRFCVV